jgi:hypothetical protein
MNRPTIDLRKTDPHWVLQALGGAADRIQSYFLLMNVASDLRLDVIVPAAEKDLQVLPYALDGLRANLRHPIGTIFVVAPPSAGIQDVCRHRHCRFVDERSIVNVRSTDINLVVDGIDRSAWIYQQILKWSVDALAECDHFLVVDADTVLIRRQVFERNGRLILNYSDEYNQPYFDMYERLIEEAVVCPVSFTSHQMLYDRVILRDLKARMEAIHGCRWDEAILRQLDRSQVSGFSDYDTYGQFAFMHYPEQIAIEYWFNLSLTRKNLSDVRFLGLKYAGTYKSISFHSYKG